MKRSILFVAIVCMVGMSCEYNDVNNSSILLSGTYAGIFYREYAGSNLSSPTGKYAASNVALIFSSGQFLGTSSVVKYPAICNGTYEISGQRIEFTNACFWTAEFDWSYILGGEYQIKSNGDSVEITRAYADQTDIYKLTLQ